MFFSLPMHSVCEVKKWINLIFLHQKHALMEQVAHQTIVMQFILELAKSLKVDPRGCFRQFFEKIKVTVRWLENNHSFEVQVEYNHEWGEPGDGLNLESFWSSLAFLHRCLC